MEGPIEETQTIRKSSNKSDRDEASNNGVTVEQLTVKTSSMNLKPSNDKVRLQNSVYTLGLFL